MQPELLKEKSIAEREHELWTASRQYLHGEIEVETLEGIEDRYAENFKKVTLMSDKRAHRPLWNSLIPLSAALALIAVGLIIFFFTKEHWALALPAISIYFIRLAKDNLSASKEKRGESSKQRTRGNLSTIGRDPHHDTAQPASSPLVPPLEPPDATLLAGPWRQAGQISQTTPAPAPLGFYRPGNEEMAPMMANPAGREKQQLGNYRLVRLIGVSGFARVYLGEHIYLKTYAALKVPKLSLSHDDMVEFLAEARTSVSLDHPHIVRVLECGVEGGETPYIVMNYAPGGTLRQRYPRGSRLPGPLIFAYVKQIASALQYIHNRGLIHQDIKPENMLLGPNEEIMLSDYRTITMSIQEGTGTASYMAPEQFVGKPRPASDQYALGVVVYEWICGESPFNGSFSQLYANHLFAPPPPLSEKVPGIPPAVEQVVMKALAKDPQQRFASVQEFANALEQAGQAYRVSYPTPARDVALAADIDRKSVV